MRVSTDFKGRILEKAATRLGYDAIPLERDSARSTVTMVHRLRDKQNILMAVDGPRGPREQVKDGSRYLTDKTDVPTIPVSVRYSTALPLFFRWDRYRIPLPFYRVTVHFGKPFLKDSNWDQIRLSLG